MKQIYTTGNRIIGCDVDDENLSRSSTAFAGKVFECEATFRNVNLTGASFERLTFDPHPSAVSSITFENCNLSQTRWTLAETELVRFRNVNLTGSSITLDQLAAALEVTPDCTFPADIDWRTITEYRKMVGFPPFSACDLK